MVEGGAGREIWVKGRMDWVKGSWDWQARCLIWSLEMKEIVGRKCLYQSNESQLSILCDNLTTVLVFGQSWNSMDPVLVREECTGWKLSPSGRVRYKPVDWVNLLHRGVLSVEDREHVLGLEEVSLD